MADTASTRYGGMMNNGMIPNKELYSSARSMDSVMSRSLVSGAGPNMVGVGIFFQQESDGKVYAKTVVSGGSAERDGRVRVGDVLCGIDGRDIIGEPMSILRSLLLGQEGSNVVLTFARAVEEGGSDGHDIGKTVVAKFDVDLTRGSPEYFARMDAARRHEMDIQECRQQLKQALAEEKEIADEIERVKRVLQLERGTSARREKELEEMRAAHAREVAALTDACRRAEQARRESVSRLAPVQTKEQDMTEELSRMKEKDRLRKEYVEELRKRHEEEASRLEVQLAREQRARREDQAARLEVERELAKARVELKRELEHQKVVGEQDRVCRERVEVVRKKFKDLMDAVDTIQGMQKDLEENARASYNEFIRSRSGTSNAGTTHARESPPPETTSHLSNHTRAANDDSNFFVA